MPYLNWLTRNEDIGSVRKASYRLLEEVPEHSAGDPNTKNILNQGDNLDALKALLGHVNLSTTQIYTHVSEDWMANIVSKL